MKKLLWLDDLRDPLNKNADWLNYSTIGKEVEVIWVKNASEFKKWIMENGLLMAFVLTMTWVRIQPAVMTVLSGW